MSSKILASSTTLVMSPYPPNIIQSYARHFTIIWQSAAYEKGFPPKDFWLMTKSHSMGKDGLRCYFCCWSSPSTKYPCKSYRLGQIPNHNYLKNDLLLSSAHRKNAELQSFRLTFIPCSCYLDPDKGFFCLCGWPIQHCKKYDTAQ